MIVWRGRGIVIAIITLSCLAATELLTRFVYHDNTYYQRAGWPKLAGFLIAALLVRLLSRPAMGSTGEMDIGNQEGKQPLLRDLDSLFHIRAKYWPPILCVLGVVFYFIRVSV